MMLPNHRLELTGTCSAQLRRGRRSVVALRNVEFGTPGLIARS